MNSNGETASDAEERSAWVQVRAMWQRHKTDMRQGPSDRQVRGFSAKLAELDDQFKG